MDTFPRIPVDESSAAHAAVDAGGVVCYHCGLPVREPGRFTVRVDGEAREMCCAGCQAVTESILGAGLEAFYRNRTRTAEPGGEVAAAPPEELAIYDRPEVQAAFVENGPDGSLETTLLIEGITCAACVWLNEQHLMRTPGVLRADVNYATRRARVRWDPQSIQLSAVLQAIQDIGYRAWPNDSAISERVRKDERRAALWRLFVAAFGTMQVMMYALPGYIAGDGDMAPDIASLMRWASLLLTLPVVLYSASPFYRGAWRDLRLGRLGMDVPVALGVGAAFLGSVWTTLRGHGEVYFDSVTMFVFFLLAGRWLEQGARDKAGEVLRHLVRALPAKAQRLVAYPGDRATETIPAGALCVGDVVLVRPGDVFPADGRVIEGSSRVDESLLTGESRPAVREVGSAVVGGTTNIAQPVLVQVERTGADTRLSAIVKLVERAHADRPRLVAAADRFAGWFVGAILLIAAASGSAWLWIDPSHALVVAVAVLVVTCPCALSLATPAALTVATGALARLGLVLTRERAIETLTKVTHVVLDKTGTLTEGAPGVVREQRFRELPPGRVRAIVAALEAGSDHPAARALRMPPELAGVAIPDAVSVHHEAGAGVEGTIEGVTYRLGARSYVEVLGGTLPALAGWGGLSEVWLADASGAIAAFGLGDRLRGDAAETVAGMARAGLAVILASGDGDEAVAQVANRCGIAEWRARCTPEDKHALVSRLQAGGAVVCMVGDGVNDAPVLARADVSIAMGTGAVLAQQTADLVLCGDELGAVVDGISLARRTLRIIRQNLGWAVVYNVVAVPLAAAGWITPWIAGIGMASSSLVVVLNALRLRGARARPRARGAALEVATIGS
ncbi:MAG: heavy metal translocating P-type ATPase [Betaproteobacteria bacterium]|nr:heavy metal translocating P-type ATPase [Betaproteobacteria bacterium]